MKQIKVYTKGENTPVSTNKYYEKKSTYLLEAR
jgi:hypothetical protein